MASLPPGPRFRAVQAARFVLSPIGFLEGLQRRYGDVFTLPLPGFGRLVYLAEPEAIKQVFTGGPSLFRAGEANAVMLAPIVGDGSVFIMDGDRHMRERKLLLPQFHGDRIKVYAETMADVAEREVARWPVGERFALRERMQRVTLEVILRTVFGIQDADRIQTFHERILTMGRSGDLVVWWPAARRDLGPLSPWTRFRRAREAAWELVYEEIDRARSDPDLESRDDVLALLLQARHEDGSPMSRDDLRDELMTVIAAGHETTATALCWFFERVLRHPEVEERLRAEIAAGEEAYLDATAKEVLRIRPVIPDVIRVPTQDVEIGGHLLPAGTYVVPGIVLVHLRPDVYPEPHAFRPERFLDTTPGTYTWFPFGGGVRRCIGAAFAMLELKVIARTIMQRARLRAADPRPETPRARHVTIVPSRGGSVVVEERLAATSSVTTPQQTVAAS